ncbi:hypothetical protein, partial [Desulfofundulus sp.]|uniref:hypothetical protein n=1 Tax=Desulfofundulus sp. TaxID=2282750 RepID=UPI003C756D4B
PPEYSIDLPPQEVAGAVRWELDALLSEQGESKQYIIRHAVTGRQEGQLNILAAAVSEEMLREKLSALVKRIKLSAVDLRACALWRVALHSELRPAEGALAVIETIPSGARIVAGSDYLQFVREIPFGEAVDLEVRRTLNFYQSQYDTRITRVLTAGSGAVPGLKMEAVAAAGEPPGQVGGSGLPWGSEYATALGLALYYTYEPRVDMLPPGLRVKRFELHLPTGGRLWLAAAVAGLFLLTVPPVLMLYARFSERALDRELTRLKPVVQEVQRTRSESRRLEEWLNVVRTFTSAVPLRSVILERLSYALPADAWLTGVDMGLPDQQAVAGSGKNPGGKIPPAPEKIYVEGYCLSASSVGAYRDRLAGLPYFTVVRVIKIELDEKTGAYKFAIEAWLKVGGGR